MTGNNKYIVFHDKPRAFNSPEELERLIQEYFQLWAEQERPVTMSGLAVFLGVTRETISKYGKGDYDIEGVCYSDTIERAREYIANDKLENGLLGRYNATITKFDLMNNHGYKEQADLTTDDKPLQQLITLDLDGRRAD